MNAAASLALAACLGGALEIHPDSGIDYGWSGRTHQQVLATGARTGFVIASRCSDDASVCSTNADCANEDCVPTCDCKDDPSCEIVGPIGEMHCVGAMNECRTNQDCFNGGACVSGFAPPMPFLTQWVPLCVESYFHGPLTGTIDVASGEVSLATELRWKASLSSYPSMPCPRCGTPEDDPAVGDTFQCHGGASPGKTCRVDAVTEEFGGTSFDCPPSTFSNFTGAGLTIPLELTTEAVTRVAALPCGKAGFPNPLEGPAKCTDATSEADPDCTSNADCRRCSADAAVPCASDEECAGKGSCAEAPEQPVTCGYWCHCGFCDDDGSRPCFDATDCAEGESCVAGTGSNWDLNAPQLKPNDCAADGFRCGEAAIETCSGMIGNCMGVSPRVTCASNADCEPYLTPVCVLDEAPRPCFESRITRSGEASITSPTLAAVSCMTSGRSSGINFDLGVTGPAAMTLKTSLELCDCSEADPSCALVCRHLTCGNGQVDPDEDCDGGDCCTEACLYAPTTTECRCALGTCDLAEYCSGDSSECPADEKRPDGAACDGTSPCTSDGVCKNGLCLGTSLLCGNGTVDAVCMEGCDDGNTLNGDGCASWCRLQAICGDVNFDWSITVTDAQRILQRAVFLDVDCVNLVCDVDSSGSVQVSDSLRVLRRSVSLDVELRCTYPHLVPVGVFCAF